MLLLHSLIDTLSVSVRSVRLHLPRLRLRPPGDLQGGHRRPHRRQRPHELQLRWAECRQSCDTRISNGRRRNRCRDVQNG